MKLKVKFMKFSAGRPVAILNKKSAANSNIHVDDRVSIEHSGKKIIAVVDIATGFVKEDEIVVSMEVVESLSLKEKDYINLDLAAKPESLDLIYEKLSCKTLSKEEIHEIISDIVSNAITEAEIAFFVAAVYKCGMSIKEIESLTQSIVDTGKRINLRGEIADKHSIGGVSGRTTPIVVSICSAGGLTIPKTSSRAITSPSGTADAMETICKVDFNLEEMKKIIAKEHACLVWGGALNLAPADDKIIQIERLINLDPESQLIASIISKKLAANSKYVLIDIPYGKYAKVTRKQGLELKKKFEIIGKHFKIKIRCSMKEVNEPLGNGIGPSLEMADVLKVLRREDKCHLLESRSLELAGQLFELTGKSKKGEGVKLAAQILNSGAAFKKFVSIVKAQHGNINRIKKAKFKFDIKAEKNMKIKDINIKEINRIAKLAGCPIDRSAGIYLYKHLNDSVKTGEKLLTIYSENKLKLKSAIEHYHQLNPIK
ncbi:thymidine phosphorylase [Candidatus Pacearchaeota archaeon]|nr:thymidine phosphorylase [Candidatus Pacearchaeota archaeon]